MTNQGDWPRSVAHTDNPLFQVILPAICNLTSQLYAAKHFFILILFRMAASNLNEYVQKVAVALDEREGVKCAELLSFSHSHIANARLRVEAPEAVCSRFMAQPFDEMVAAHIKVCIWAANKMCLKVDFRRFGLVRNNNTMMHGNIKTCAYQHS